MELKLQVPGGEVKINLPGEEYLLPVLEKVFPPISYTIGQLIKMFPVAIKTEELDEPKVQSKVQVNAPEVTADMLYEVFKEMAKNKKHVKAKAILSEYGFDKISELIEKLDSQKYKEVYKMCQEAM